MHANREVGRTGEAEAEEKIEAWDREALKRREKKRRTEENRRAFRARAESWVKPKDRTWKWLYRAKTVPPPPPYANRSKPIVIA